MNLPSRIALAAELPARGAAARERLVERLPAVLEAVALQFTGEWAEAMSADEKGGGWSGLLTRPDLAFDLAVAVQESLWPGRLRFALASVAAAGGHGSRELDTLARERARARLREAPAAAGWFLLDLAGRSRPEQALAESAARLYGAVMHDWTPARAAAVAAYRRSGRQTVVAEELGITQQAVSQMLLGAHFRSLLAAQDGLRGWLRGPERPGLWPLGAGPQRSASRVHPVPGLED